MQFPPLLERALGRKQAAAESEGVRWQLEKKEMEILEMKKMVKARTDDISNYKVPFLSESPNWNHLEKG